MCVWNAVFETCFPFLGLYRNRCGCVYIENEHSLVMREFMLTKCVSITTKWKKKIKIQTEIKYFPSLRASFDLSLQINFELLVILVFELFHILLKGQNVLKEYLDYSSELNKCCCCCWYCYCTCYCPFCLNVYNRFRYFC